MAVIGIRAANPIWYFPDLTGLPLNDTYYAFFLTNVFPYVPQSVFQTVDVDPLTGIPWNNPIEFFPNGTLPDNLYFNPNQVYRIEIRQGNTQSDPLIYEINDFVPNGNSGGGGGSGEPSGFGENQSTMSTFSEVNFASPLMITGPGTYNVAPGWDLIVTGAGTGTITQNIGLGNQNFINDPNFALGISLFGFSSAMLVQRFNQNGALWMSTSTQDGYVSMSITAQAITSTYAPITFFYTPSTGTPIQIGTGFGSINTGPYQVYDATQLMPQAITNSDPSNVAYVDMVINLLGTGNILITNIQIVGQEVVSGSTAPATPIYQQQTNERQIDHLFHYYRNSIIFQPKATILTGWNFPLNPFQFVTTTVTPIAVQTQYIADQTILHQEAASQLATGAATFADNFGLVIQAVSPATTTRFALIQYIDTSTTDPYWGYNLSALVKLRFNSTNSTNVKFKMLLLYRSIGAPPTLSASEPIAGWSGTDLTIAPGWTAIKPVNDPSYSVSTSALGTTQNYTFNGFALPIATSNTMYLAAVFYTVGNISSSGTPDYFVIDSISLVNNDFAIDTQAQTFDDVLRQCQYYYEKSYDNGTLQGASTLVGVINKNQTPGVDDGRCYGAPWEFQFNTVKRAIPVTSIFSTVGTINNVSFQIFRNGTPQAITDQIVASFWTAGGVSTKSVEYLPNNMTAIATAVSGGADNLSCSIRFHYAAQAILGT